MCCWNSSAAQKHPEALRSTHGSQITSYRGSSLQGPSLTIAFIVFPLPEAVFDLLGLLLNFEGEVTFKSCSKKQPWPQCKFILLQLDKLVGLPHLLERCFTSAPWQVQRGEEKEEIMQVGKKYWKLSKHIVGPARQGGPQKSSCLWLPSELMMSLLQFFSCWMEGCRAILSWETQTFTIKWGVSIWVFLLELLKCIKKAVTD